MTSDQHEAPTLALTVNGTVRTITSALDTPLLFVLRNELGLKGAKLGCGLEQCGSCAVMVNGERTLSCNAPVAGFVGKQIVTPESANHHRLAEVRDAFVRAGAAQCGYCIPGMVIAATALLLSNRNPSRQQINDALQQHLCRCGSQQRVLQAIRDLSDG